MAIHVDVRAEAARNRRMATLQRTIASLHSVIRLNGELGELPRYEASAHRRVSAARQDLATAQSELAKLRSRPTVTH